MKIKLSIFVAVVTVVCLFTGCGAASKANYEGTYVLIDTGNHRELRINKDQTAKKVDPFGGTAGSWKMSDDKSYAMIDLNDYGMIDHYYARFDFEENKDILTLYYKSFDEIEAYYVRKDSASYNDIDWTSPADYIEKLTSNN